ncbi:MAG: HNH endonuclease [Cyanobium sp.]
MPSESSAAKRCLPTAAAIARRSAARSKSGFTDAPGAGASAAGRAVARQIPHQRALEVDHIVPRNQGGSDDLSNLQALCFRCNAGKRDAVCRRKRAPPTSAICRPATPCTRQAVCSACWSSSPGGWRGQRSKCDQILISNRSETAP